MRSYNRVIVLGLVALCSCKMLKKGDDAAGDGGALAASAEGGVTTTSAAKEAPVSTTFELVAAGKKSGSKIVWLRPIGDRVWLSGMGLDAYADGDGPLATSPDLTQGLKQKQGESYDYTGNGNLLFALRTTPAPRSQHSSTPARRATAAGSALAKC